jgi:hypothetical protein
MRRASYELFSKALFQPCSLFQNVIKQTKTLPPSTDSATYRQYFHVRNHKEINFQYLSLQKY